MAAPGDSELKLPTQELCVDEDYWDTSRWQDDGDQFNRFFRFSDGLGIANSGGFRFKSKSDANGSVVENAAFCVLVTTHGQVEWPDSLDRETGIFTYFGDNRKRKPMLTTKNKGNRLLEVVFDRLHDHDRGAICPFLCFEKFESEDVTDTNKYMRFLGLAVPGAESVTAIDYLVAVWGRQGDKRFQNYKAIFTILDAAAIPHSWLDEIVSGVPPEEANGCPPAYARWVATGKYEPLITPPDRTYRRKADQLPRAPRKEREQAVLDSVRALNPRQFEYFAKKFLRVMDPRFFDLKVTREVVDGGHDVVGQYRVGHEDHWISLEIFAEAKHWADRNSVGVEQVMRLISRIKHRDFGIVVTTSSFGKQVQEELIKDGHPVVLVAGGDIARTLIARDLYGYALETWLDEIRQEEATKTNS